MSPKGPSLTGMNKMVASDRRAGSGKFHSHAEWVDVAKGGHLCTKAQAPPLHSRNLGIAGEGLVPSHPQGSREGVRWGDSMMPVIHSSSTDTVSSTTLRS